MAKKTRKSRAVRMLNLGAVGNCTLGCRMWQTRGRFPATYATHAPDCTNPNAKSGRQ